MNTAELLGKVAFDQPTQAPFSICKVNTDKRLVTGQVYAPDTLDSHGHFMSKAEVARVAHQFLADGLLNSIDVMHDNETIDAVIVESFIARKGDPDYEEGAWVATTKINNDVIWNAVKNGDINGYSFEILTYRDEVEVDIEYASWYYGFTDEDPHDKHTHPYLIHMNNEGEIVWGMTGLGSDGSPAHSISQSNITDEVDGLTHRIHMED